MTLLHNVGASSTAAVRWTESLSWVVASKDETWTIQCRELNQCIFYDVNK